MQLTPHECRVLGVLVEKAQTTPAQYPLTLNSVITGSNQKSNREPVLSLNEDQALDALDGLRTKGLAREVALSGSRVEKFRHVAREGLDVSTNELVVLAELLMRGPQTVGELRGRASRMHPLESLEIVENILDHLMKRETPFVQELAPAPGSRAKRYAQLLCPDLHPLDAPAAAQVSAPAAAATPAPAPAPARAPDPGLADPGLADPGLADRVDALEREVAALRDRLEQFEQLMS